MRARTTFRVQTPRSQEYTIGPSTRRRRKPHLRVGPRTFRESSPPGNILFFNCAKDAEMRHSVRNLDSLADLTPKMSSGVETIIQFLGPEKHDIDQCRRDVRDAIRMIGGLPPSRPPSFVKNQLLKIATKLKAAETEINKMPLGWRHGLDLETLLSDMDRARTNCEGTGHSLLAKSRGGGSQASRTAARLKLIAAGYAADLLIDWGHRKPSLTKSGKFHQLTIMLIETATGRQFSGDVERACAQIVHSEK
jgi:hypothetical protein